MAYDVVAVLGASGYLGSKTSNLYKSIGILVYELSRKIDEIDLYGSILVLDFAFPTRRITRKIRKEYLKNLLVNLTIASNLSLKYIYMGSYSSNPRSESKYGALKREAESLVLKMGGNILRIGLVVDYDNPGGRFKQFVGINKNLPVRIQFPEKWCPMSVTSSLEFENSILELLKNNAQFITKEIGHQIVFNDLISKTGNSVHTIHINERLLEIISIILRFVPLGKLDFLRSILYRESRL
jgi:hypothetical protein